MIHEPFSEHLEEELDCFAKRLHPVTMHQCHNAPGRGMPRAPRYLQPSGTPVLSHLVDAAPRSGGRWYLPGCFLSPFFPALVALRHTEGLVPAAFSHMCCTGVSTRHPSVELLTCNCGKISQTTRKERGRQGELEGVDERTLCVLKKGQRPLGTS